MPKPSPELREKIRQAFEQGRLADENMQQVMDRVDARREARIARMQRAPLRRLLGFFRAA